MDIIADGQTTLKIVDEIIIPNDVKHDVAIEILSAKIKEIMNRIRNC